MKIQFGSNYCVRPPLRFYWAWFLINNDGVIIEKESRYEPNCPNNVEASYLALIDALQYTKLKGILVSEYETDCPSVVNHIRKTWVCETKKLQPLIEEVNTLITDRVNITLISRKKNRLVDKECYRLKTKQLESHKSNVDQILAENFDSD